MAHASTLKLASKSRTSHSCVSQYKYGWLLQERNAAHCTRSVAQRLIDPALAKLAADIPPAVFALTEDRQVHASIRIENDIEAEARPAAHVSLTAKHSERRLSHCARRFDDGCAAKIIARDDMDGIDPASAKRRLYFQPD